MKKMLISSLVALGLTATAIAQTAGATRVSPAQKQVVIVPPAGQAPTVNTPPNTPPPAANTTPPTGNTPAPVPNTPPAGAPGTPVQPVQPGYNQQYQQQYPVGMNPYAEPYNQRYPTNNSVYPNNGVNNNGINNGVNNNGVYPNSQQYNHNNPRFQPGATNTLTGRTNGIPPAWVTNNLPSTGYPTNLPVRPALQRQ